MCPFFIRRLTVISSPIESINPIHLVLIQKAHLLTNFVVGAH